MSSWYPFRSREVVDITSHLTVTENLSLQALAKEEGTWVGKRAGITSVCAVVLVDHLKYSFLVSVLVVSLLGVLIFTIVYGSQLRKKRKEMREFLCSTAYAREAGYQHDSLRLYRFWF
jgi:hypothetical protein